MRATVPLPPRSGPNSKRILCMSVRPLSTYPKNSCSAAMLSESSGHSSSRNESHFVGVGIEGS